ncbi:primosomal protein N' [Paenibacillus turpanensis]|uniref:primosomal protein N' n=1 Tax=Paenibacillus turpanensis TaxID=2689078 RepID=UPI00140C6E14
MTAPLYARIIVDVPARPADRPFDYSVPDHWQSWIAVGSRVAVTFAGRVLQGIVVGLSRETDVDPSKLRGIEEVLDAAPPLTEELIELSDWVSRTYACPRITSIGVMLPAALKAQTETKVSLSDNAMEGQFAAASGSAGLVGLVGLVATDEEQRVLDYIRQKQPIKLDQLTKQFPDCAPLVKSWTAAGVLELERSVKDRLNRKKVQVVEAVGPLAALAELAESLPARAAKQKEVLLYLQEQGEAVALAKLTKELGVSSSAVKALESKGWVTVKEQEVLRDPYEGRSFAASKPLALTDEQQAAYGSIVAAVREQRPEAFLMQGITGSGKTEVYLQSIQACLDLGREAIVLVPEISLTPQMVERFKSRFGDLVAVLHSRLSNGERYDEWRKIAEGGAKVAVGARSAVFAPFTKLGLIIIDEEHESSYKQEDSPKYHAREVALQRGRMNGAPVVLGSATPSLESYARSLRGAYTRLLLSKRALGGPLPAVQIVDMRDQLKNGNRSMFSKPLHEGLEARLERGEQSVLLLNRRGYSTFVMCRSCGYTAECPHCDISLTYHQSSNHLRCHYCGFAQLQPELCPECESPHIRYFGTGTQRVEEELAKLFPGIRVIRMDVDTTSEKGSHEKWLNLFRERKADVLLGTQMVAKGLDFPYVTLVGVIAADTVLNLPDFRAAEKTFQLLTQVAGRAGRHQLPGEVVIQTYNPEHYSVLTASRHDYEAFVGQELELRKRLGYPPYCRLICVTFSGTMLQAVVRTAEEWADKLRSEWGQRGNMDPFETEQLRAEVLGPVASPIPRLKDRYRFQCVVKIRKEPDQVIAAVRRASDAFHDRTRKTDLQISIDVDPQMMM